MKKEIFILGAGASTDFENIHRTLDPYRPTEVSKISDPFPVASNFLTIAINKEVLKSNYPQTLWEFIKSEYNESFESLKSGNPLNVEQLYIDLDTKEKEIEDWTEEKIKLYLTKLNLIEMIEKLWCKLIYGNWVCLNHAKLAAYCIKNKCNIISLNWDTLIDDALSVTGKWFYDNGYGINFYRTYCDSQEFNRNNPMSSCLLLKPHGSLNWFKYRSFYSGKMEGFSGEAVSEEEREDTGLFLFSLKRRNPSECHNLRLNMGRDYNRLLKMPAKVDIVPPGEYIRQQRSQYQKISSAIRKAISETDKITIIGFALKDTDSDLINLFRKGRQASRVETLIIEIVNKSKGNVNEERRMREVCSKAFDPCRIEFSYSSLKEYCEHIT